MRLTLRTLLAYLDDILDPADKEQLAKKIESSEFAEDLVHRTRDAVRRLRLSAPQVIGSGMGLDPNTVAEYLDNVLPPESVGDFERICLESDMHLAEAAACHHVLTMVLGEPADVDVRARQRMYTIATEGDARRRVRVEPAHVVVATEPVVAPPLQVTASPAGLVATEPSGLTEVPDYLRARSWPGLRMLVGGLAAAALVAAVLYVVGDRSGWFDGDGETNLAANSARTETTDPGLTTSDEAAQDTVVAATLPSVESTNVGAEQESATTDIATSETPTAVETPSNLDSPPQPLTPSLETENTAAQTAADTTTVTPPTDTTRTVPLIPPQTGTEGASEEESMDIGPALSSQAAAAAANDARPVANVNEPPPDSDTIAAAPLPMDADANGGAPTEPGTADLAARDAPGAAEGVPTDVASGIGIESGTETATEAAVPAGPVELGTYLGDKTVLLRYDDAAGGWFRVQPRSAVASGDRLLALPEFRPKITLASGIHLDISGGTQVSVRTAGEMQADGLRAADANSPGMEVIYGRVILINTSMDENQIRVGAGPSIGDARLARNATLAIEVERQYVPGNDPQQTPPPVIARFYVPSGGVEWQDASGTKKIDNTARWAVEAGEATDPVADASPPDWIDQEPIGQRSEHLYGAPVVENTMVSDKPADIQLLELFQGNARKEVKSLAAKSSVHVGLFEPFIDALRDSEQKANWPAHIQTLRAAMALSPESAGNVKRALEEQRGRPAADDLYEMLCGYNADQIGRTPDEMRSGALARLIDWLEEDSLDYRVLAVHNLWETTGKRLMPNPAANLKERTQNVRRWRSRLEAGDLAPVGSGD
ncbi:MAG TPA: hypothetical protein VGK58_17140 [Lacipirellulaceae bacterium]